jgi:hypothetical protein
MKDREVCKLSICPLTYETLNPKYHSRSKRKVLENKSDYEQANNKVFTSLLINKIHHMLSKMINMYSSKKNIEI